MPRKTPAPAALPARQPRSLQTRERILSATEALLTEGDAELITIEQIAERAHVSVGAIYKRFEGKASLLPLVLERVQVQQFDRLEAHLAEPHWHGIGLAGRIDGLLALFARSQTQQRSLIRALVIGHWQSPDRSANDARASGTMTLIHAWLAECLGEIRHPTPGLALSLGLYTTLQTLQTAILMERVPAELGIPRFTAEMSRLFRAYLGLDTTNG
ncbi:TetR/AcrR family transcriptional regulator [Tahibacter sp. UC22_41]|uniref:TetR/AcrR family transcriptional regulator n=1 Tax=Tahibacter sp. UC22_41 TaxID=3350178 RepID=UPI0036D91188